MQLLEGGLSVVLVRLRIAFGRGFPWVAEDREPSESERGCTGPPILNGPYPSRRSLRGQDSHLLEQRTFARDTPLAGPLGHHGL